MTVFPRGYRPIPRNSSALFHSTTTIPQSVIPGSPDHNELEVGLNMVEYLPRNDGIRFEGGGCTAKSG